MIYASPTTAKLLQGQQGLPDRLKQSTLLLTFREPVPEWRVSEFYRIRMTPMMIAGGEESHYMASIWQEDALRRMRRCAVCREPAQQMSAETWQCLNPRCSVHRRMVLGGPKTGVVQCVIFPDFIVADEETEWSDGSVSTTPLVNRVLLALDRRYSENVLSQVKRCAFNLAEMLFMPLRD